MQSNLNHTQKRMRYGIIFQLFFFVNVYNDYFLLSTSMFKEKSFKQY